MLLTGALTVLLSVEQILERRRRFGFGRQTRVATALTLALHLIIAAVALVLPQLTAKAVPPRKVIQAQIVPLQALGVPDPPEPTRNRTPPPPPRQEVPPPPPPPPSQEPLPQDPPPPQRQPDPELPVLPRNEPKPAPPPPPRQEPREPAASAPEPLTPSRAGSATGNARGTSAFGAAVASLDNPDFTYGYYVERMVALIRSRWTRPPVPDGTQTTLHFRILKNGTILELEIREGSGQPAFDRAAVRAVSEASPLPPLPVGYRQDSLGVTLVVQ